MSEIRNYLVANPIYSNGRDVVSYEPFPFFSETSSFQAGFGSFSERNRWEDESFLRFLSWHWGEVARGRGKIDYGNSKKLGHSVWLPLPPAFSFLPLPRIIYVPTTFRPPSYFSWPASKLETHPKLFVFQSSLSVCFLLSLEIWRASFCPLDFARLLPLFYLTVVFRDPPLLTIYPVL